MKHIVIALLASAGLVAPVAADSARQAFFKAWEGQSVVVKASLYSLVYNERGVLGNKRSGLREGVLVVTSSRGQHLQFDGRQGRETVVATDPSLFIKAVSAAYQPDALEVRSYRKVEPLTIEQFVPGAELIVRDVRIDRDVVTLKLEPPDGSNDTMTSLRVKWPLPLSSSFSERLQVEGLLRQFVELKHPSPH